jgi:hypothetical protein
VVDNQIIAAAVATVPTMIAVFIGILNNNARLNDMRAHMDARFSDVDRRFNDVDRRFTEMDHKFDRRFDDLKDTWRAELHRVEEVIDARLKHLEER